MIRSMLAGSMLVSCALTGAVADTAAAAPASSSTVAQPSAPLNPPPTGTFPGPAVCANVGHYADYGGTNRANPLRRSASGGHWCLKLADPYNANVRSIMYFSYVTGKIYVQECHYDAAACETKYSSGNSFRGATLHFGSGTSPTSEWTCDMFITGYHSGEIYDWHLNDEFNGVGDVPADYCHVGLAWYKITATYQVSYFDIVAHSPSQGGQTLLKRPSSA